MYLHTGRIAGMRSEIVRPLFSGKSVVRIIEIDEKQKKNYMFMFN